VTRLVLAAALAAGAAAGCDGSVCRDVSGACVALKVDGSNSVDGLEITLSGATSGHQVAPEEASLEPLPVEVALAIDKGAGVLHIAVVGVAFGQIVGSGSTDVTIAAGKHVSATVTLKGGANGGGGGGGSDGGVVAPFDVTGTRVAHYLLADGGVVDVPTDFTGTAIGARVGDGGVAYIAGSGDANGNFTIHNVSAPYDLVYGSTLTYGASHHIDLGEFILGRADQAAPTSSTHLSLYVGGVTPWTAADGLEMFSINSGTGLFAIESVLKPSVGATSLSGTLDLSTFPFGNLIDQAKGDDAFLSHFVGDSNNGVAYRRLAEVASFPPFTITNGGSQSVSATMTPVTQDQSLAVSWSRSAFAQLGAAVNPQAASDYDIYSLFAQPGGLSNGFFASTPDLAMATPGGSGDVTLTMTYGNPFPARWPLVVGAGSYFKASYVAAGASAATFDGAVLTFAPLASLPSPVAPVIGPVQSPTIDGMDAFTAQTAGSATPLVSWMPPALGTASGYVVNFYAIDNVGNKTSLDFLTAIYTGMTSVMVPPGLLVGGQSYFVDITAYADGIDRSVTPFLSVYPSAYADALSAAVTVDNVALGASCKDILASHPGFPDGWYTIDVDGAGASPPFAAYCDMTTAGGGWTLCAWSQSASAESSAWATPATAFSSNWYGCYKYSATPVDAYVRVTNSTTGYVNQYASVDFRPSIAETSYAAAGGTAPDFKLTLDPGTAACGASSPMNFQWGVQTTATIFGQQPSCSCSSGCQAKDYQTLIRSSGVNSNGCSGANQIPPQIGYSCGGYGNFGIHMELWAR
jgi:hypothetical protein